MRGSKSIIRAMSLRHLTRRSTLLSMGHRLQSWKATSVAQATRMEGTQTTELLMLSPSQPSENEQLLTLQLQPRLVHGHGDGGLGGDVGAEAVDGPHVHLVAGGEDHVLDHAGQGHDLGLREGVRENGQSEMVIGVEVRDVDVGEVLPHGDDLGHHPVGVAQKLRGVDEDGVPLPVEQGGVAVEAEVAVQEDLVLE